MQSLIQYIIALGYVALFAAVFAESGLFFGFFLPGDSLLFTAGLFAAAGHFNIIAVSLGCFLAAFAGDQVGYWFGAKVGRRLYSRENSFFFRRDHLEKAREFYDKHGRKTIIFARFIPFIRTFSPIVAGTAEMPYFTFLPFSLLGGFSWGFVIPVLGYFLGSKIPSIDRYLLPIIVLIIIVSLLPAAWTLWGGKRLKRV